MPSVAMIRGHYAYYGITGNVRRIRWYGHQVVRIWKKWLTRRGAQEFPVDPPHAHARRDIPCRRPGSFIDTPSVSEARA